MKYILIILIAFTANGCLAQTKFKPLPKGTIIGIEPDGSASRIGDSAWHYVGHGFDFQFSVLKSAEKYPFGVWTSIGKVYKNPFGLNPKDVTESLKNKK